MPKLTDNQLIVLTKAAARDDGVAVAPHGMGKAAAAKIGSSLVARKLMRESRSKPGMPVWREAEGKNISLVITRAGRDAIGVEEDTTPSDCSARQATCASAVAKTQRASAAVQPEGPSICAAPRTGSKQALIVDMLSKEQGVTIDALIKATGDRVPWRGVAGWRDRHVRREAGLIRRLQRAARRWDHRSRARLFPVSCIGCAGRPIRHSVRAGSRRRGG